MQAQRSAHSAGSFVNPRPYVELNFPLRGYDPGFRTKAVGVLYVSRRRVVWRVNWIWGDVNRTHTGKELSFGRNR
jgi:hypothetical protein